MFRTLLKLILSTLLLTLSCGESTGPSDSAVSPSELSVTFTGSTDKSTSHFPEAFSMAFSGDEKSICRVTASWTMCTDQGFGEYQLYRSQSPGIQNDPSSAALVATIEDALTTNYSDETVTWNTEYYYALRNTGDGSSAWSNEVSITTPEIAAPTPSVLISTETTWMIVELDWTECPESNFQSYRLYRSTSPNIQEDTASAVMLEEFSWRLDTTCVDTSVTASTDYYYALRTTNSEDISSWSNELHITTMGATPYQPAGTITVGTNPWDITSLPSDDYVYVTNRGSNDVSVIRTADNTVTANVPVGQQPFGICSSASGDYVYTANSSSNTVSVIRTADNTLSETVEVGENPVGLCVLPSGDYLYVSNRDDDNLHVIRTSDNTLVDSVEVGTNPYRICSIPSGEYVYVTNWSSNSVSVVRTSDNTLVKNIGMYTHPIGISAEPSGDYVYVTNYSNDVVAVIKTSNNTVLETVKVGDAPWGTCAAPCGQYVYVNNSMDNTVSIIRVSDNKELTEADVGISPSSVEVISSEKAYVVNYAEGTLTILE